MGRPKGSKNKKGKPFQHDANKIAEIFGLDVEKVKDKVAVSKPPAAKGLEAEAVIDYTYNRGRWYDRKCKNCNRKFAANYKYVSFCSMKCRKDQMDTIGLGWSPEKTEDQRWYDLGVEPPGIVPPVALAALLEVARRAAEQQEKDSQDANTLSV